MRALSWSSNHPRIKFMDMSNECMALSAAEQRVHGSIRCQTMPFTHVWLQYLAKAKCGCSHDDGFSELSPCDGGQPGCTWSRSTIGFKRDCICWYLDATYCVHQSGREEPNHALTGALLHDLEVSVGIVWLLIEFYHGRPQSSTKTGP